MKLDAYFYAISVLFENTRKCYSENDIKGVLNYSHQVAVIADKIAQDASEELYHAGRVSNGIVSCQ